MTVSTASAALALIAAPGCGTVLTASPTCPDSPPSHGASCPEAGMECTYPDESGCGESVAATCNADLAWNVVVDIMSCNPPACPVEVPSQGDPCEPTWEPYCTYTVETVCGPVEVTAECSGSTWSVVYPDCNPPPPESCFTITDATTCKAAGPTCRWLEPGCAEPGSPPLALSQAGCFPADDCVTSDLCPVGTTCEERVYNPCFNQPCDACGAGAKVCVAP